MDLSTLRTQYRSAILALAEKYRAENVRVFGSVARGDTKETSDIDFLVHMKKGASLLDEAGLEHELGELLKTRIDLLGDDAIRDEFLPFIMKEAVPL